MKPSSFSLALLPVLFLWKHTSSGFILDHLAPQLQHGTPSTQRIFQRNAPCRSRIHSPKPDHGFFVLLGASIEKSTPSRKEVEVWLDLRSTALFPKEAIDYLNEELGTETRCVIDKVVLPEDTMEAVILQHQNTKQDRPFLYVPSGKSDLLFLSCSVLQKSLPCGKLIRQEAGVMFNPILVLDIVMVNGGWVLMESEDQNGVDELVWMEEVSSLLTFLLSSTPATAGFNLNGSLDISDSSNPLLYFTTVGNGVAVACPTESLLMEVSKTIMTLPSLLGWSSMSVGGILLPKNNAEDGLSTTRVPEDGSSYTSQLPIALVLPLDIRLWMTAMDLVWGYAGSDSTS